MSPSLRRHGLDEAVYAILDAAPSAVVAVDADGAIDYLNSRAAAELGYQPEELLGQDVEVLVPRGLEARHRKLRAEFATTPEARSVGVRRPLHVRRKDGSQFPAQISLMPLETSAGLWVVTTITDITAWEEREARLRELSSSYLALAEMNQAIVRAPDEQALFRETCRIAVEQGGYLGAWVAKRASGDSVVSVASVGVLDQYIARLEVTVDPEDPRGRGPTGLTLRSGTPTFITDIASDPATRPWRSLSAEYGVRSVAALPLHRGLRTTAAISMYSSRPVPFDEQLRAMLASMAENVSYALETFDSAGRLQRVARERTELSSRLVAAQEEERARIAADVHDDSVQSLAAVYLRLGLLHKRLQEEAPGLAPAVTQLQDSVADIGEGLRDLLFDLEPADGSRTLPELVEEVAHHVFDRTGVKCSVVYEPWSSSLSETVRVQALRIVKEALVNARKHSNAAHVDVVIEAQGEGVEVTVTDDGVGFDADATSSAPGHRGLANMQDRAAVVGGWCRIERGERGMAVRFWVPYADTEPGQAASGQMAPGY
ncbi:MAG: domain S-box-containing protein [Marmoricola sp.]|nr:domain S-box-containing protein [Marmoricola sp.]